MNKEIELKNKELEIGFWRVNTFGDLVRSGQRWRIYVSFSELREEQISKPYKETSETGKRVCLQFHVSYLLFLKLGSIWKDGKLFLNPSRDRLNVALIHPLTATFQSYTEVIPSKYLQSKEDAAILRTKSAMLLKISATLPDMKMANLYIPCSEVIRYFFGVSQRMISLMLEGNVHELFDIGQSNLSNRCVYLRMKKQTSLLEAGVLAEVLSDKVFKEAFYFPLKHIRAESAQKKVGSAQSHQLWAKLPITKSSTMSFVGMPFLSINGDYGLYVLEIVDCPYSLAFDRLVRKVDEVITRKPNNGLPKKGRKDLPQYDENGTPDDLETTENTPNSRMRALSSVKYSSQFNRYNSLETGLLGYEAAEVEAKRWMYNRVLVDELSHERGNSDEESESTQGVDTQIESPDLADHTLTFFLKMIDVLKQDSKKTVIKNVYCNGDALVGAERLQFCVFPNNIPGVRSWHQVTTRTSGQVSSRERARGGVRSRVVVVVEISSKEANGVFYLMEMEAKTEMESFCTFCFIPKNGRRITPIDLNELLVVTALKKNWPHPSMQFEKKYDLDSKAKELFKKFRVEKIKHPDHYKDGFPHDWAKLLRERIRGFGLTI